MRRRFIAHFLDALLVYPDLRYITLTCDPKVGATVRDKQGNPVRVITADESRQYLKWCWQKWRKRLRRRGLNAFVGTWEKHESGWWHIHALVSVDLDEKELREEAFESGFGASVDVQLLRDAGDSDEREALARTLGYILAYISKAEGTGARGIMCSEGDGYWSRIAKHARLTQAVGAERADEIRADKVGAFFHKVSREDAADVLRRHYEAAGKDIAKHVSPLPLTEWSIPRGKRKPNPFPELTSEERKRFRMLSRRLVSMEYRQRLVVDGVEVVRWHRYTPDGYEVEELPGDSVPWRGSWRYQKRGRNGAGTGANEAPE